MTTQENDMTKHKAIRQLNTLPITDPEAAHSKADAILLEFLRTNGHPAITKAYKRIVQRCGWWACG